MDEHLSSSSSQSGKFFLKLTFYVCCSKFGNVFVTQVLNTCLFFTLFGFFPPKCQALVSFVKHLCFIFTSVHIFLLSVWHLCFFYSVYCFTGHLCLFLLCLYYSPKCRAPVFFFSVLISPKC